jgi:hypothetical protein
MTNKHQNRETDRIASGSVFGFQPSTSKTQNRETELLVIRGLPTKEGDILSPLFSGFGFGRVMEEVCVYASHATPPPLTPKTIARRAA